MGEYAHAGGRHYTREREYPRFQNADYALNTRLRIMQNADYALNAELILNAERGMQNPLNAGSSSRTQSIARRTM